jgi:hypothetical protein
MAILYTEEYQFSAVHEAGRAVCAACFPPPLQKEIEEESAKSFDLPFSHPMAILPFLNIISGEAGSERPSRIREIIIGYDAENNRFDGVAANTLVGLSNEQQLVVTLGGKVAEFMARTEGHWDVTEIQSRMSSGEFDKTNDMEVAGELLRKINESSQTKRSIADFVSIVFSFLEAEWDLVMKLSDAVISKYHPKIRKAMLSYGEFSPEIQILLHQLERMPYLKNV